MNKFSGVACAALAALGLPSSVHAQSQSEAAKPPEILATDASGFVLSSTSPASLECP